MTTMAMMLYKDFIANVNDSPILSQSDETVQQAVYDWFKYRYIGFEDTSKFLDILQRNVSANYPMYQQKLRIEPGFSSYDWLVQMYRERQLKTKGSGNSRVTYNSNNTGIKTGSDTTMQSGGQTNIRTGGQTDVKSGDQTAVRSGNQTNTKTGGHITTDTQGTHTTTDAPHVNRVTTNGGHVSGWSGDTAVNATLPMSKSYSHQQDAVEAASDTPIENQSNVFKSRAYEGMPSVNSEAPYNANLDWSTVSGQSQSGHRQYSTDKSTVTQSYEYGTGVKGDITTVTGDADNPDKNEVIYNDEKDTLAYNDVQDKTTYNDVTDKLTYDNVTDKTTYDNVQNVHTYNALTDTNTHGGSDTTETGDERTDREQVTGRNEDPATILMRATAFIEQSSAWLWLKEQLKPCFYPGYYTDEVTEEGSSLI